MRLKWPDDEEKTKFYIRIASRRRSALRLDQWKIRPRWEEISREDAVIHKLKHPGVPLYIKKVSIQAEGEVISMYVAENSTNTTKVWGQWHTI